MLHEKKKYIVINAHTDEIDSEYEVRTLAESEKSRKELKKDFSWRVRMVRYVDND